MQHALEFPPTDSPAVTPLPEVQYDFPADAAQANGLVLVGEAPGAEEARLGHPFVGRSGQLLDKVLVQAGIDRKQCLVANVFRFRPPGNKVDHFFISRRAAKTQGIAIAEEYGPFGSAYCRAEFAGEVAHLQSALTAYRKKHHDRIAIIALGRTPLWALTGESGLLQKAGTFLPCRLVPGIRVMPTYHPSFILRGNWGLQDEWASHLKKLLRF
ncbi:MAG: uracil-DNA glycosylase [Bdellovibrionales bacterium]